MKGNTLYKGGKEEGRLDDWYFDAQSFLKLKKKYSLIIVLMTLTYNTFPQLEIVYSYYREFQVVCPVALSQLQPQVCLSF